MHQRTLFKSKNITSRMRENIYNHLSGKCLISRICKEHLQLNNKKQIIQFLNGQRTQRDIFSKKIINDQKEHEKITQHQ